MVYFKRDILVSKGQSVVEYFILFAILAVLSLVLVQNIPSIFNSYVATATDKMK